MISRKCSIALLCTYPGEKTIWWVIPSWQNKSRLHTHLEALAPPSPSNRVDGELIDWWVTWFIIAVLSLCKNDSVFHFSEYSSPRSKSCFLLHPMMASEPVCIQDFEPYLKKRVPFSWWGYFAMGANSEQTLKDNQIAFQRYYMYISIPETLSGVLNVTC